MYVCEVPATGASNRIPTIHICTFVGVHVGRKKCLTKVRTHLLCRETVGSTQRNNVVRYSFVCDIVLLFVFRTPDMICFYGKPKAREIMSRKIPDDKYANAAHTSQHRFTLSDPIRSNGWTWLIAVPQSFIRSFAICRSSSGGEWIECWPTHK